MNPTTQQAATQTQNPAPVVTPVTPQVITEAPKDDILKRVAQTASAVPASNPNEAPKVSVTMDDIKDPVAREILTKRLAEANQSIAKTFGEVGSDKARLMKQVDELNGKLNQPWTPQRIQAELLARQDFIASAQTLQAQAAPTNWEGSQEEWSGLTPKDKQLIQNALNGQQAVSNQMNQLLLSKLDSELKQKFPDYDASEVDSFYRESAEGRVAPDRIREMIYKALKYETHINRAVELTKADRLALNQERVQGMTPNSSPTTMSDIKPEKLSTESNQSWMSKVAKWNLAKVQAYRSTQRT